MTPMNIDKNRRRFLGVVGGTAVAAIGGGALLTLWPGTHSLSAAEGEQTRLLVVMLRGAMDGLHLLPPVSDPDYRSARGALAVTDGLALDGSFALHPKMQFAHGLYGKKQLLPLVATAPPYQQRSHFEAQNCLENGTASPGGSQTGWLGRCVSSMTSAEGVAVASVMPLTLRGAPGAQTWSPPLDQAIPPSVLQQLQPFYAEDSRLATVFKSAFDESDMSSDGKSTAFRLPQAMAAAAKLMSPSNGPRIGFVEDSGWDTHRGQAAALQRKFTELDAGIRAAHDGFGTLWSRTLVVVVTEFGRTVKVNGTAGTDHGTGGIALMAGGGLRGGRIIGDWPGLGAAQLNDGRDLRATTDLRSLFKGVLAEQMRIPETALETKVFPDSGKVRRLEGLLA